VKPYTCVALAGAVIVYAGVIPAVAGAQAGTLQAAVAGIVPVPIGPIVDNRNVGVGGELALRYAPVALPNAALRLELSGLLPSSHDNGGTDQNTTLVANGSSALMAMAGPEFDVASLGGHFYATATAGAARIWATSAASSGPTPAYGPFATVTGVEATNFAWSGGGGFVTSRSSAGLAGDFGLRYYDLGRATYVTSYPAFIFGEGTPVAARATVGHHRTTVLAPSIGLSWRH
jgi:hypothetical protein